MKPGADGRLTLVGMDRGGRRGGGRRRAGPLSERSELAREVLCGEPERVELMVSTTVDRE